MHRNDRRPHLFSTQRAANPSLNAPENQIWPERGEDLPLFRQNFCRIEGRINMEFSAGEVQISLPLLRLIDLAVVIGSRWNAGYMLVGMVLVNDCRSSGRVDNWNPLSTRFVNQPVVPESSADGEGRHRFEQTPPINKNVAPARRIHSCFGPHAMANLFVPARAKTHEPLDAAIEPACDHQK